MSPDDVRAVIVAILSSGPRPVQILADGLDVSGIDFRNFRDCWHCKKRLGTYDSLCHVCYADLSVRRIFQAIYAEWKLTVGPLPDPSVGWPTTALPGSRDKLRVFADRLALGLPLFHPGDAVHHD